MWNILERRKSSAKEIMVVYVDSEIQQVSDAWGVRDRCDSSARTAGKQRCLRFSRMIYDFSPAEKDTSDELQWKSECCRSFSDNIREKSEPYVDMLNSATRPFVEPLTEPHGGVQLIRGLSLRTVCNV